MIRKYFGNLKKSGKEKIKWRSHEPSRIEAISDAVFAFAVSLLVFSLEVPKNSEELRKGMSAFFPFICCFAIMFSIWYTQYKFFRHYGLHDGITVLLNAALLVIVLFYVYPLKFMFTAWLLRGVNVIELKDAMFLVLVYNGGFAAIYLLFSLMYGNAYLKRAELNLTTVEVFETLSYVYEHLAFFFIGIFIIILAVILNRINVEYTFTSLIFYGLCDPVIGILGNKRKKLFHKKFGAIAIVEPELGSE